LPRRVKQAGRVGNRGRGAWEINYDQAIASGPKNRIVKSSNAT